MAGTRKKVVELARKQEAKPHQPYQNVRENTTAGTYIMSEFWLALSHDSRIAVLKDQQQKCYGFLSVGSLRKLLTGEKHGAAFMLFPKAAIEAEKEV